MLQNKSYQSFGHNSLEVLFQVCAYVCLRKERNAAFIAHLLRARHQARHTTNVTSLLTQLDKVEKIISMYFV